MRRAIEDTSVLVEHRLHRAYFQTLEIATRFMDSINLWDYVTYVKPRPGGWAVYWHPWGL